MEDMIKSACRNKVCTKVHKEIFKRDEGMAQVVEFLPRSAKP
jgi:hypothetical protein